MSERPALILDNVVLSSFRRAGWFGGFERWAEECELLTTRSIWAHEFRPDERSVDQPAWLGVESPTLEDVRARGIGRLSIPDWSCIALAEERANARIVTDDRTLRRVAREREIGVMWGAALAIEMFETCAISTKEYRAGLDAFIDDLFLNPAVVDALESASKSG